MSKDRVELQGSHRPPPVGARMISPTPPEETAEISIYVQPQDGSDDLLTHGPTRTPIRREGKKHKASARAFGAVIGFATDMGLAITKQDPQRRLVKVRGTIGQLETAFGTKLHTYAAPTGAFRARAGSLSLPKDVAPHVEAVLGLDTRPIASPRLKRALPHALGGHLPNEISKLYRFPTGQTGKGHCIAIIELGGGFRTSDNKLAFQAMKLAMPEIIPISVSGGNNAPGGEADGEVALDIQVAGAAAPGARLAIYFAPNTIQGFVDAITRAVNDEQNRPSVISISWGSAEDKWTDQALAAMNSAFRDAASANVTVLAASGDNLATDGLSDGQAHVDFPASSPYVIGCGGTVLDVAGGAIEDEQVWNGFGSGTGGGISGKFPTPAYQKASDLPNSVSTDQPGRGVPDVAGNADPASGYRIVLNGMSGNIGGTSAVAPLLAGLVALVNEAAGRPIGFIHPVLYGNPGAFRDITKGDNKDGGVGYDARAGWDACTGMGVPIGSELLKEFFAGKPSAAAKPGKKPKNTRK